MALIHTQKKKHDCTCILWGGFMIIKGRLFFVSCSTINRNKHFLMIYKQYITTSVIDASDMLHVHTMN